MRVKAGIFLLLVLLLIPFKAGYSAPNDQQQWILYFQSEQRANTFAHIHKQQITNQYENILLGYFSEEDINSYQLTNIITKAEPNVMKEAANTFYDPMISQQWGLPVVKADSVYEKYSTPRVNLLERKELIVNGHKSSYNLDPISATEFKINMNKESVRRFSVEITEPKGEWTVTLKNVHGELLGKQSSLHHKIDILFPSSLILSEITIQIHTNENWNTPITINKLSAYNSVVVAVIDSGISLHEDYCDNILYSLGKDFREGLPFPEDRFGHGTHVAGIIAACSNNQIGVSGVIGFAPVDILPLKVLDRYGSGGDFEISKAVYEAINLGADVINLSIAGKGQTLMLEQAINKALNAGIPVVAAAGNWNISTAQVYPASYPGVITVSGITESLQKVPTSDYGWEVDIAGPGYEILSTYTNPTYKTMNGTSMAAPFVSAALALYKLEDPKLDFIELRQLLAQSAMDIGKEGYDKAFGYGVVQIKELEKPKQLAEFLTLRDGQTYNERQSHLIGFSQKLYGKQMILFAGEQILLNKPITKRLESFELVNLNQNKLPLTLIVSNSDHHVIESIIVNTISSNVITNKSFTDVDENYWSYNEIEVAAEKGYINGYPDQSFRPSASVTRRHSVMMLNRLIQLPTPTSVKVPFTDMTIATPGVLDVLSGYEQGLIKGSNNQFSSNSPLTRGQMSLILARALGVNDTKPVRKYSFQDVSPSSEIYWAVQNLTEKGIISKQANFRPNDPITRAQFATMLVRAENFFTQ